MNRFLFTFFCLISLASIGTVEFIDPLNEETESYRDDETNEVAILNKKSGIYRAYRQEDPARKPFHAAVYEKEKSEEIFQSLKAKYLAQKQQEKR